MARQRYSVTVYGTRKSGGSASFEVEVEVDDSFYTSNIQGNNDAMKAVVLSQRPDVMTSHGPMEDIKVIGISKVR